ncbi:ATP-binding protein [Teredinibacter franksiae]|uniref:ATP-binding protein n=1 Tax=Teredinibacter franksiae TaxID=2761453 RepID=UPI001629C2AF|nr:ATP-binding protein [Teredinibacter franksiae]
MNTDNYQQGLFGSVMSYITVSLATIIAITLISIFVSFWVTELADKDAQAINLSGSMRMQTYRIGLALERGEFEAATQNIEELHKTWNHSIFAQQHSLLKDPEEEHSKLTQYFAIAYFNWLSNTKPALQATANRAPTNTPNFNLLLENQVLLTDTLVNQFQKDAERKIVNLRTFQLAALFITVLVGSLIFYLLKNRVEKPLSQLTETAERISEGDFNQRVDVEGSDELSLLAETFNRMSKSIADSYNVLEERVEERTRALQQNNIALEFLITTARNILESHDGKFSFSDTISDLSDILGDHKLELCLFTEQGQRPYLQLVAHNRTDNPCEKTDCNNCRNIHQKSKPLLLEGQQRFSISMGERHFGIIDLHINGSNKLPDWQQNLIQSVANQFAVALSMGEQKDRDHRFAMLSERTVIARELHDSLAQALSYLQIQVTRLQKSKDRGSYELQQPIIDELREGLSSAYRQLRELLTTFRLKMDEGGLKTALESTVEQLRARSDMAIVLDYQLVNLPLDASEEIHLLQIVREAGQNAIHHSRGQNVLIRLEQKPDKSVELIVTDDGVGIPNTPEKLNHYGLAIMNERSRNLGGEIDITSRPTGGTQVSFVFTPSTTQTESLTSAD